MGGVGTGGFNGFHVNASNYNTNNSKKKKARWKKMGLIRFKSKAKLLKIRETVDQMLYNNSVNQIYVSPRDKNEIFGDDHCLDVDERFIDTTTGRLDIDYRLPSNSNNLISVVNESKPRKELRKSSSREDVSIPPTSKTKVNFFYSQF